MGVIIKGTIPRGPHHFPYVKCDLPGTPKDMGPPYGKQDPYLFPYHSRDSKIGSAMSLGVPENPTDCAGFHVTSTVYPTTHPWDESVFFLPIHGFRGFLW